MSAEEQMLEVEVTRLKQHPSNPRRGDVDAIARSLKRHGQVKPLIVQRSTGYVVAGNHTLKAIVKLGWDRAKIVVRDMTDDQALEYLLTDNATSDKGTYDDDALYGILAEALQNETLEGTGYTVDDVETLAAALGDSGDSDIDAGVPIKLSPDTSAARFQNAKKGELLRDIILMMPVSQAEEFGAQVRQLQERWGTRTVVDTVRRAVSEASA